MLVVAWAAPVAKLFFDGREAADPSASLVRGRRTFITSVDGDLRDYEDDLEPDCASEASVFPLPTGGRVAVPRAPQPVVRPRRPTPSRPVELTRAATPAVRRRTVDDGDRLRHSPDVGTGRHGTEPADARPTPRPRPETTAERGPETDRRLRAARSVRSAVEAPKTGRLGSVLATLQPDQYGIVTWPDDQPLIVQGQPGTGKTIVATHRAAYLTHAERAPHALRNVAVVGPTEAWRQHVSPSLTQLGATAVTVLSMQELLSELSSVPWHRITEGPDRREDTDWALGRFVDDMLTAHARTNGHRIGTVRSAVDLLSDAGAFSSVRERHPEASRWFADAGAWSRLSTHTRNLPVLAAIGQAVGHGGDLAFDHLIVDEAQDVRPLEWKILLRLLRREHALTLLGDVNQRRVDWTAPTWTDLAVDLEITDDDGSAPVVEVHTGYRSTKRILRFANQLLPRGERRVDAIREGVDPSVERVPAADLGQRAVETAQSLAVDHSPGMVAIITMTPRPVSDRFRQLHWSRPADLRDAWRQDEATVMVLRPERARGLEFDAVVVVEPANFPENVGRLGTLYTSMTRATKDLAVLHSRALPRQLRPPRRK